MLPFFEFVAILYSVNIAHKAIIVKNTIAMILANKGILSKSPIQINIPRNGAAAKNHVVFPSELSFSVFSSK